jgi:DNA-binding NtrC family response regulator
MRQDQLAAVNVLTRNAVIADPVAIDFVQSPKKRTLLWVDDSRSLLSLYKVVFETLGFEVLASFLPEDALRLLSSHAVDVAILDYDMPAMNGGMLASLVKSEFPMLPVILYTGNTSIPNSTHRCVDAICAKAAPREELLAVIERLAREAATRPASSGHLASFLESAAA